MKVSGELDEWKPLLEQFAAKSPDIFWMFAADWSEVLFVNDRYEEVWGRPIERLEDDPSDFMAGIHPDDRDAVVASMERLSAGESAELEYRVNDAEDYGRWVWVRGEPVYEDGEVIRIAGYARDITERKEYERELERTNERLDSFAGVLSHDLRNPLNVAQGRLELLDQEVDHDHIEAIDASLERIDDIIDDVLVLAREGTEITHTEAVSLAEFVRRCWRQVDTTGTRLDVRVGEDATVQANPDRLSRLFENLFRNSVEHGQSQETVTVGRLDDGFYVADDGVGIPEGERTDLFGPVTPEAAGKLNLGLNIVKAIVEAHGWRVSVHEAAGGGARFEVHGVETSER